MRARDAAVLFAPFALGASGVAAQTDGGGGAPVLEIPVRCALGKSCYVQQYADHDASADARDYRCGPMSYDGHDGTDFRVPSLREQKAGVDVLAAAAGTVRAVRDGMADQDVRLAGVASVKGRECGNGVAVSHAGGWETQYCHMARGSIAVREGDRLEAGTRLGQVGQSGEAAFPHLHLTVRQGGKAVDPFAASRPMAACGTGASLWSAAAQRALAYRSPDLINAGFASAPLDIDDVESGNVPPPPRAGATVLIAYIRCIGLRAGDVGGLSLHDPAGKLIARQDLPALMRNRAQQFLLAGARRATGWPSGTFTAKLVVRRGAAVALSRDFTLRL